MRLLIIFLVVLPLIAEGHFNWFRRPMFDCRRIHRGHCCASRIRAACPHICMNSPCSNFPRPDGPPPPSGMGSNIGGLQPQPQPPPPQPQPPQPSLFGGFGGFPGMPPPPQPGNIFAGLGIPGLLPPPPQPSPPPFPAVTPPSPFGSIGVIGPAPAPAPPSVAPFGQATVAPFGQGGAGGFPTLLPETATAPAISSFIEERGIETAVQEKTIQIGSNGAVDGIIKAGKPSTETGRKKNKGILKPPTMTGISPDELVELVDYESGDKSPLPIGGGGPPPDPPTLPPASEAEQSFWTPAPVGVQKVVEQQQLSSDRTTIPVLREGTGSGLGSWKFSIRPSGYKSEGMNSGIEVPPNPKVEEVVQAKSDRTLNVVKEGGGNQGIPNSVHGNEFNNKVGELIGSFLANNSLALGGGLPRQPQPQQPIPPIPSWATNNNATVIPASTLSPHIHTPGVPVLIQTITEPSSEPCNIPPDFRPCVSAEKASSKLLDCCKQRLMPPGCLELCRYDITQAQIRRQFDQGKCGLLHVAPFLECASGGNNNLECCKHRQVAQKSGPQCEVFCNPAGGIGALGLQHLACQNVIGDLLQCHHSGVRPF